MEEFSLNNTHIELFRPHKNPLYIKLTHLQEVMKSKENQRSLMFFFFSLIVDSILNGNKIMYINEEVIYMNKENDRFKYYSKMEFLFFYFLDPALNKVSFDSKNIIYIHPYYLRDGDRSEICRLKYLLWSIAILILKFVLNINFQILQKIHKNFWTNLKRSENWNFNLWSYFWLYELWREEFYKILFNVIKPNVK